MANDPESLIHDYARRYSAHDADGGQGASTWSPVEIESRRLGDYASFETVRWNALDGDAEGWRFLSYTNHF